MNVPQAERVHIDLDPAAVLTAFAGQRRRFASEVASLDASELATLSRCTKWSAADVLRHLSDVDGWMRALWSHQPPPFTSFDPNTTPHEFVVAARTTPDETVRDRYMASSEEMAVDMESAGAERWGDPSISPLGAVPWWLSVLHIFWDSWLHERDVLLPLGVEPPQVREEVVPVLSYAVALAGTLVGNATMLDVAGVRLVTQRVEASNAVIRSDQSVTVTPVAPDDNVAPLIDAMAGRGDAPIADDLRGLARMFLSG